MNDSGYCSSLNVSAEAADDEGNYLLLKTKRSKSMANRVFPRNEETIADLVSQKIPKIDVKNTVFLAKLRGHQGIKWVPFSLPCGLIEKKTEIEWEQMRENIYKFVTSLDSTKSYSKPQTEHVKPPGCKVFFVSPKKKYETEITHLPRKKYGRDADICVIAHPDLTCKEALINDGRFKNVESFTLKTKVEGGGGHIVELNDMAADLGAVVLQVSCTKVKPATPSKSDSKAKDSAQSSDTIDPATLTSLTTYDRTALERDGPILESEFAVKLGKNNAVYVFSRSVRELSTKEMLEEMEKCLRLRNSFPNATESIKSVQKFANKHIIARPVAFSKTIGKYFDSVGFLKCGSIEATSFLVSKTIIATNYHVAVEILKCQNDPLSRKYHEDVFVHFDYEYSGQKSALSNGFKIIPFSYESIELQGSEEFDYVFLLPEKPVEDKLTLGQFVRSKTPERGNVCIIGHPGGNVKQDEVCPLLPFDEIERRCEEEERCRRLHDPSFYICRMDIENRVANNSRLLYDVGNMFHGSSGSPVLDMSGYIVGLHTLGYTDGTYVHMEVAVKFKSIIDDLLRRNRSEFVNTNFPQWECEEMES